jgi:hypothetical protein
MIFGTQEPVDWAERIQGKTIASVDPDLGTFAFTDGSVLTIDDWASTGDAGCVAVHDVALRASFTAEPPGSE